MIIIWAYITAGLLLYVAFSLIMKNDVSINKWQSVSMIVFLWPIIVLFALLFMFEGIKNHIRDLL